MLLSDIIIYPIKSLPGVRLDHCRVVSRGLEGDRRWMIVDENNRFMTIRNHREMLSFDLSMGANGFVVKDRKSGDVLELPWEISAGKAEKVSIWDDEVEAIEGRRDWSSWFEAKLGKTCRLVYMHEKSKRPIKKQWAKNNEIVSFADGYPLLVVGSASLVELNEKLKDQLSIDRFRPNLVFEGGEPYEEFKWSKFTIGGNQFQGFKPCKRCIITTLDPITAEQGPEPLATLSRQRIDNKVVFGQHAAPGEVGTISIGDEIRVISYKDSPYDPV